MVKIITCIPAYNEEKTIARVVIEAQKYSNLVVVCDDGSTDYTGIIAEKLGAIVVKHRENRGKGAALRTLFKKALEFSPDIVVTLDADQQHDPKYIPLLVNELIRNNADIAIAARARGNETPPHRRLVVKVVSKLVAKNVSDVLSGFRAYRTQILKDITPQEDSVGADIEILDKALNKGLKIIEVHVPFKYRGVEKPLITPISHIINIVSEILREKIVKKPLTYLALPGLFSMFLGLTLGLWVVKRYIEVRQLAIGTAIITAILLISGLLLVLTAIHIFTVKEYAKLSRVR